MYKFLKLDISEYLTDLSKRRWRTVSSHFNANERYQHISPLSRLIVGEWARFDESADAKTSIDLGQHSDSPAGVLQTMTHPGMIMKFRFLMTGAKSQRGSWRGSY